MSLNVIQKVENGVERTGMPPARASVGLGACVEYIKSKIIEAEKSVKFRDDSCNIWRGGTDETWLAVGCSDSKAQRLETANRHGCIAIKCRKELQTLKAVLEHLEAPNASQTSNETD